MTSITKIAGHDFGSTMIKTMELVMSANWYVVTFDGPPRVPGQ
jgi:hypothetical protein